MIKDSKHSSNTGDWNTGECNTGNWNPGNRNTGNRNTGECNTGDCNTGDCNTGNWNTGNRNTGECNTGNRNTGDWNTGNWNTGNWNIGNWNTGDRNTGVGNTGDWNTGDWNTGNWNTGDWNNGYCNTIIPDECFIFNKLGSRKRWNEAKVPYWMCARLTNWIKEEAMSDKEKEAYPSYVTTGGYLKCYSSLHAAFIESWEETTEEDRRLTAKLPNFDPIVFKEIFGFTFPTKYLKKSSLEINDEDIIEINGIKYRRVDEYNEEEKPC